MSVSSKTSIASDLELFRAQINRAYRLDEDARVDVLLSDINITLNQCRHIENLAANLVVASRKHKSSRSMLDAFMEEYGLSSQEGVALMCIAEALLRIPDDKTRDDFIADRISNADWDSHKGHSESMLVNASTWGLMLTGRVVRLDRSMHKNIGSWFGKLVSRLGEPTIRAAMLQAMRIMSNEFVLGRTIGSALKRAGKESEKHLLYSFDMLGEGARTHEDAERYLKSYTDAIHAIGKANISLSVVSAPGISVKLSALHPNYNYAHEDEVMAECLPVLKSLALLAKEYRLGFTLDAEEAERLELSLNLFEALAFDSDLRGWQGLGLAVQAYQKRAVAVIDWLIALGHVSKRRLMVRLVKGAYWDYEVKHSQVNGLKDYPVYTRKVSTDVSYLACAQRMLGANDVIYSQFATHNAHTLAAIHALGHGKDYEFQRLHGMGDLLYRAVSQELESSAPCRIYAPVGEYEDLLPYLVRRLLENGANSSFVNRFLDAKVPVESLVEDPLQKLTHLSPKRNPQIPKPSELYGEQRLNSDGIDLSDISVRSDLLNCLSQMRSQSWFAAPIVEGELLRQKKSVEVINPANQSHIVGSCCYASEKDVKRAVAVAYAVQPSWNQLGGQARADILLRIASEIEHHKNTLIALLVYEAGKTVFDAVAELREAVDFCRYYAMQGCELFVSPKIMPGPTGESNELSLHGRGVFACISPWNFPLAIFVGQVTAALMAGNAVIAKPAEQTPLIACEIIKLMHQAGVPEDVLHFLPGLGGTVGAALVAEPCVQGVAFTGSTETAKLINLALAQKEGAIVPLIAETGGQNAMIVDSTALIEQVVDDVIRSAFLSAGQRCSALRVLCVQEDVAELLLSRLSAAMDRLTLGDPSKLSTDCGPVIDNDARAVLENHIQQMRSEAKVLKQYQGSVDLSAGSFFPPTIIELRSISQLQKEVFGPVLHVIRFRSDKLDEMLALIDKTGFGLTLGVHSRIEGKATEVFLKTKTGNTYVNRDMVGAVVGVQPFGGCGLSGTGPKAGGPYYLHRFATERTKTVNTTASGGNAALFTLGE